MSEIKNIIIKCADSTLLAATIFIPKINNAAVMIAPATGIKREVYEGFAKYLMSKGYGVITYDNSGIGDSLFGKLKKSKATLVSWGQFDMTAVLETLKVYFPNTKYHLVGHSAGGQLVGLMPNSNQLSSMFNVACSSGSIRNMIMPFKMKAVFFMRFFIPINNFLFGYTNSQWVGMGEPLPYGVAKEWGEWCSGSGYVKMAFGKTVHRHWYDELCFPSIWLNSIDDSIANNKNVDEMIAVYSKMPFEKITLTADDSPIGEIAHMKFFSRKNKKLWHLVLDWLNRY